jgi:tetratricopeptide (TPR) repeat protein
MRVWLVSLASSGVMAMGLIAPLALGLIGPFTSSAHAQSDDERARVHFEAGRSYYEQARYDDAAREWQQSFELSGRPELLLNISQAQERALRYDDAIGAARQYLVLLPEASDRKTVEDRIVNLEELRARFERGAPAPLEPPGSLPDTAGPGGASATDASRATTPSSAGTPVARAQAEAPAPTALPELEPHRGDNPLALPAIVLMGVGGATLVASLVTGLIAHGDYESLERQCDDDGLCPREARDELDEGESLAAASTVLAIVGVIAAGTGGALLIVGAQRAESQRAGEVSLGHGPTPLSLSGTVHF